MGGGGENLTVAGRGRADDHLRALPGGGEARRGAVAAAVLVEFFLSFVNLSHGALDGLDLFIGGELDKVLLRGQFDVGAEAIGEGSSAGNERGGGSRDGFEVDVAAKGVIFAQGAGNFDQLFHGVVGRLDDAGAEKEAFDVVAAVEVEGEIHHFSRGEAGARNIAG